MSHFPGIPCFSAYERLKKLCTYTVLGSFITNILMPSYMLASTETMLSHDNSLASGRLRTGIMLRTSPLPFLPFKDSTKPAVADATLSRPSSLSVLEDLQDESHDDGIPDDQSSVLSDHQSQNTDASDDEYGATDDESDVSDITILDDLWGDARYVVTDQPNIIRYEGRLFDCSDSGVVRVSFDPQLAFDQRPSGFLHVLNPYGAVILDEAMDFQNLYVEALGFEAKANITADACVLNLMQADGRSQGLFVLHEQASLLVSQLSLNHVSADLKGTLALSDGAVVSLDNSRIDQHKNVTGLGGVTVEGKQSSWYTHDNNSVLRMSGDVKATGVSLSNKGIIEAEGLLDWQGDRIDNAETLRGKKGVVLTANQGDNSGRIASTQGGVEMSAAIKTLASGSIESNEGVSFKGDRTKDVVLEGTINAKMLKVDGKNLTNKATVEVSEANLAISGTLDQQKKLHADHLTFTGNRIINQGDTNIGELTLTQKVDIEQRLGKFEVDRGTLHIGQFKDAEGTETLLPKVTMDQKDGVIYGHVDIKHFNHSEGAEFGNWKIPGRLMVHGGSFQAASADVTCELGLGGSGADALIEGPLSAAQTPRDLNRAEKKAILWQLYEANRYTIRRCGEAGMHPYYHMLAWMHETQFFEKRLQHGWILEEMINNAGAWEWDTSRYASSAEVAWFRKTEAKRSVLPSLRLEAMRSCMKDVYQNNLSAIHKAADASTHAYFRMLKWLDDTSYFATNIHQAWMRPLVIEHAAHWGWRYANRTREEQRLYDVFKGNVGRAEAIRHQTLQHWYKKNPQRPIKHVPLYGLWGWMDQFSRGGSFGYAASIEDLFIPWRGINAPLELPDEEGGSHTIRDLQISKSGKVSMLSGGRFKTSSVRNEGVIRSLKSPLKLINTTALNLGVIEMNNDELIVEADDGDDLIKYVEKSAHQWLMHRLRLSTKRFHLKRDWHFTYRSTDGSNAPFMWGGGSELERVWEAWREKESNKKIACDVVIDVVEFINHALLNVTGRLEIISEKDLDNRHGRIRATTVDGSSIAGKVRIGAPVVVGYFHNLNGAFIMSDQDMTLYGHEGIEIDFGVLTCLGNMHFLSPQMLNCRGSNIYIKGNTRYELQDLNLEITPIHIQKCSASNSGQTDNDWAWDDGKKTLMSCSPNWVQMGGDVELFLGYQTPGLLNLHASFFITAGRVTNRRGEELTTQNPGMNVIKSPFVPMGQAHHKRGKWWGDWGPNGHIATVESNFQTSHALNLTKVHYFSMSSGTLVTGSASIEAFVFHVNGAGGVLKSYNIPEAIPILSGVAHLAPGRHRYSENPKDPLWGINTFERGTSLPLMPLVVPPEVYEKLYKLLESHPNVDKWMNDEKLMISDFMKFLPSNMRARYSMDLDTLKVLLPQVLLKTTGMAFLEAHLSVEQQIELLLKRGWQMTIKPGRKRIPLFSSNEVSGATSFMALRLCDFKTFNSGQDNQGSALALTQASWQQMLPETKALTKGFMWDGLLDPFLHVQAQDSSVRQALNRAGCALIAVEGGFSLKAYVPEGLAADVRLATDVRPAADIRPSLHIQRADIVAPQGDVRVDSRGGDATFQGVNIDAQNIDIAADELAFIEDHDIVVNTTYHDDGQTTHVEKRSVGNKLNARGKMFLRSLKGALTLQHITMKANKATLFSGDGMIRWLLGTNMSQTITTTKEDNGLWQTMRQDYQEHHTYSRNDVSGVKQFVIETNPERATRIVVQEVEGYARELSQKLRDAAPDAHVEEILVREIHTYSSTSRWSLTRAAMGVFMLGVMLATQGMACQLAASLTEMAGLSGMGATVATGAVSAGLMSATQVTAGSLVQNEFHMGKVLKDVGQLVRSKELLATMAIGGVCPSGSSSLPGAMWQETQKALLRKVIVNEEIRADRIATGAVATVIQAAGSQEISGLKADHRIDSTQQVLMHGVVHGVGGAVRGIPDGRDGMLTSAALSAAGAMSAEALANILVDPTKKAVELAQANPDMDKDQLVYEVRKSLEPTRNAIQLIVAAGGVAMRDERAVEIMAYSAGTALDYNTFGEELEALVGKAMQSKAVQLFKAGSEMALKAGKEAVEKGVEYAEEVLDWVEDNPKMVGVMGAMAAANAMNGGRRGLQRSGAAKPAQAKPSAKTTRENLFGTNDVAASRGDRVKPINGQMPDNHKLAGQTYKFENVKNKDFRQSLQQKYPYGVPFTGSGFPDFSRYAMKKAEIKVTGNNPFDFAAANRLAGLKKTPDGYTWHHHHDSKTMLLIPQDLHSRQAVPHTGGAAIARSKGGTQ